MKEKKIICEYYICEHKCALNRDAVWEKTCQKCSFYKKKKNSAIIIYNNRKKKLEQLKQKEIME